MRSILSSSDSSRRAARRRSAQSCHRPREMTSSMAARVKRRWSRWRCSIVSQAGHAGPRRGIVPVRCEGSPSTARRRRRALPAEPPARRRALPRWARRGSSGARVRGPARTPSRFSPSAQPADWLDCNPRLPEPECRPRRSMRSASVSRQPGAARPGGRCSRAPPPAQAPDSGASNTADTSAVKPSSSADAAAPPRPNTPCSTYASPSRARTVIVLLRGSAIQYSGMPPSA